jgi:spermidine/putrescine transport system substrate-binding protein
LTAAGLLEPLDRTKIKNFVNIDARFRGLDFDPSNSHTVPYMWGMTGVAWNTKSVPEGITSWKDLFDGAAARKTTYLDDGHEVLVAAMFANGDDPRKPTPESIRRAAERVARAKPTGWDSAPKTRLVVGDYAVAHAFSGDARQAAVAPERVADIAFAIPSEGGTIFVDNIAIAKGAREPALAHAFLDYLLRPEVSATITREMKFGNPNAAARALLPKELLDDPILNPPESTLSRCVFLPVLTPDQRSAIEKAWAEIEGRG